MMRAVRASSRLPARPKEMPARAVTTLLTRMTGCTSKLPSAVHVLEGVCLTSRGDAAACSPVTSHDTYGGADYHGRISMG